MKTFFLAISVLTISQTAFGQAGGIPRYQPATPTVGRSLNLLQRNTGLLPNFYSLVRPAERQGAFNRRSTSSQNQQQRIIIGLKRKYRATQASPTGTAATFMQPGAGERYSNTLQYYGQWRSAQRR